MTARGETVRGVAARGATMRSETVRGEPLPGETVDWRDKALWPVGDLRAVDEYVAEGHSLFDGSISWPAMVLRESALAGNLAALARFCSEHDLDFAPHGKTSMAPALFARQLEAGAWGITVATAQQARVAREFGAPRVLLAHELLDATALDWAAHEIAADPRFWFACFVDSAEGVRAAADAGTRHSVEFPVVLDVGYPGGRTGVRTPAQSRELAELIGATDGIRLVGVSAYEGGLPTVDAVRKYFAVVRAVVGDLVSSDLLVPGGIITAGGSAYFDVVASELGSKWASGLGLRVVLRSGAYVAHDDGIYVGKTPFQRIPGRLDAAIEVWAQVVSTPEPGLAFVGMGKRDAPYDAGMPVPLRVRRVGSPVIEDLQGQAEVSAMDDQHGYLRLSEGLELRPGDLIGFGISHPCTAFDKWRAVPIVDDGYRIVDVVRTYF